MKFGFVGSMSDPRFTVDLAIEAEAAGWDGFFLAETVWGMAPWVVLAAVAARTVTIHLGTMLTPLAIRKPWTLAAETATLDNYSGGRVILSVGLGAVDTGFGNFGEPTDRKTRAKRLDEGLAILDGLWRGQPFHFEGEHYHIRPTDFPPPPLLVQKPRIPIWVVGAFPHTRSMQRAMRWDGLLPAIKNPDGSFAQLTPANLSEIKAYIQANRPDDVPYDIVVEGTTPGEEPTRAAEIAGAWEAAGATWWIESMWDIPRKYRGHLQRRRIRQGPPV